MEAPAPSPFQDQYVKLGALALRKSTRLRLPAVGRSPAQAEADLAEPPDTYTDEYVKAPQQVRDIHICKVVLDAAGRASGLEPRERFPFEAAGVLLSSAWKRVRYASAA